MDVFDTMMGPTSSPSDEQFTVLNQHAQRLDHQAKHIIEEFHRDTSAFREARLSSLGNLTALREKRVQLIVNRSEASRQLLLQIVEAKGLGVFVSHANLHSKIKTLELKNWIDTRYLQALLGLKVANTHGEVEVGASVMPITLKKKRLNLPESSRNILREWLQDNEDNPYPSTAEKSMLAQQAGITVEQVANWFTNARVRILRRKGGQ
jgi:hypothetical protein